VNNDPAGLDGPQYIRPCQEIDAHPRTFPLLSTAVWVADIRPPGPKPSPGGKGLCPFPEDSGSHVSDSWKAYQYVYCDCELRQGMQMCHRKWQTVRSLRSTGTSRLLVPSVKRSAVGSRAFHVAGPKTWNALPEDVTSSQSEYTFRRQLKTRLFNKSFPDIII